jgi:hypothetical protein
MSCTSCKNEEGENQTVNHKFIWIDGELFRVKTKNE